MLVKIGGGVGAKPDEVKFIKVRHDQGQRSGQVVDSYTVMIKFDSDETRIPIQSFEKANDAAQMAGQCTDQINAASEEDMPLVKLPAGVAVKGADVKCVQVRAEKGSQNKLSYTAVIRIEGEDQPLPVYGFPTPDKATDFANQVTDTLISAADEGADVSLAKLAGGVAVRPRDVKMVNIRRDQNNEGPRYTVIVKLDGNELYIPVQTFTSEDEAMTLAQLVSNQINEAEGEPVVVNLAGGVSVKPDEVKYIFVRRQRVNRDGTTVILYIVSAKVEGEDDPVPLQVLEDTDSAQMMAEVCIDLISEALSQDDDDVDDDDDDW